MKKLSTYVAGAAVGLMGTMAQAADDVTLQLKWVTQAQFAGYYVAQDKGFYEEEDLNVTIKPGGPDIAPTQVLAGGGADVAVEWMPAALAAREKGLPMVNIAQPFKSSGMMLTCRKDAGIETTDDFKGKTLGVWFFGNEFPFLSWMNKLELPTEGGEDGVTVLKQGFNVDPLLQNQAACVSTDPAFEEKMVRFVRASMKGWKYAEQNPDEAAEIVLDNDASGAQTEEHQKRMMGEVAKLTAGSNGALDEADYERTVQSLLSGGSDPVITAEPSGAWTHAITDKALN